MVSIPRSPILAVNPRRQCAHRLAIKFGDGPGPSTQTRTQIRRPNRPSKVATVLLGPRGLGRGLGSIVQAGHRHRGVGSVPRPYICTITVYAPSSRGREQVTQDSGSSVQSHTGLPDAGARADRTYRLQMSENAERPEQIDQRPIYTPHSQLAALYPTYVHIDKKPLPPIPYPPYPLIRIPNLF